MNSKSAMSFPLCLAFGAVMLYLMFMPWLLVPLTDINGHDASRMVELALMTFCALMLALDKGQAFQVCSPTSHRMQWGMRLLWLLTVASVATAAHIKWAFIEWASCLGLGGIAVVMANVATYQARNLLWLAIAIGVCVAAAIETVVALMVIFSGQEMNLWFLGTGYVHPRFLNHMQTIALPLSALALLQPSKHRLLRYCLWMGVALSYAVLFLLGGRGTLLGICGGLGVVILMLGKRVWPLARTVGLCLVFGLVAYVLLFQCLPWIMKTPVTVPIGHRVADVNSIQSRQIIWQLAWASFKAHPWLGIGPMHFAAHQNPVAAHPHNLYLQMLAEWGVGVTALCASGLLVLLFRLKAAAKSNLSMDEVSMRMLPAIMSWALMAVLLDGLFSGLLVMPVSQVWFAVLVGMAVTVARPKIDTSGKSPSPEWRSLAFAIVLLLGLLAVWCLLQPQWSHLATLTEQPLKDYPSYQLNPRWWVHGWIH